MSLVLLAPDLSPHMFWGFAIQQSTIPALRMRMPRAAGGPPHAAQLRAAGGKVPPGYCGTDLAGESTAPKQPPSKREPLWGRLLVMFPAVVAAILVAWTAHLGGLMVWGVPR